MTTPTLNSVRTERVSLSENSYLDSMLVGTRWASAQGSTTLSFSFPGSSAVWAPSYTELREPGGLQPFTAAEREGARSALEIWSHYADLTFIETSDTPSSVGELRFATTTVNEPNSVAHAYSPANDPAAGDVWFDSGEFRGSLEPGDGGFFVLLHEIGHALGLKHPFEASPFNSTILDPALDNFSFTVMSYTAHEGDTNNDHALSILPTTPMLLDIAAIQYLYGPARFAEGNTEYVFSEDQDYFETIYDTGGNDTIVWNSKEQFAIINLVGGNWSSLGNALYAYDASGNVTNVDIFNVAIYFDTVIENVRSGASDDDIYGNEVANRLDGGGGHDIIWGHAGADTILGGAGNDHLYGQSPTGGTDSADSISGGDGSDYIQGNAGNDRLNGDAGSDRINGGANDDNISGGAGNDTVNGNLGSDTIDGGDGDDSLRGGQGGDSIRGGAGSDLLAGDLGADTLSGGTGNDLFVFSGAGSSLSQADRILDYADGADRISIGFAPVVVLTASAQSSASVAATTAQQLFDANAGNGEVAALMVGGDTYLFYAGNGGGTVDSAIIIVGVNAQLFGLSDFA